MITVDTNLIAYLTISGPLTDTARRVYTKDPEWVAPTLWRSEYLNVLALYLRKGLTTIDDSIRLATEALSLMAGHEYVAGPGEVLRLVAASKLSAYDCEFVSVAKRLNCRLVTTDKDVLKSYPKLALHPDEYLSI